MWGLLVAACSLVARPTARVGASQLYPHRALPLRSPAPRLSALVSPDELRDEVLRDIVLQKVPDQEVNELAWRCLGYEPDPSAEGGWNNHNVFPNWRKKYPKPPDLLGVTRTYSREVDEPVLRAVQALQRSVPREHKDQLKPTLKPIGWKGFKMEGLTPNMTRRAQVSTWLLYYRKVSPLPFFCRSPCRCQPCATAEQACAFDTGHMRNAMRVVLVVDLHPPSSCRSYSEYRWRSSLHGRMRVRRLRRRLKLQVLSIRLSAWRREPPNKALFEHGLFIILRAFMFVRLGSRETLNCDVLIN